MRHLYSDCNHELLVLPSANCSGGNAYSSVLSFALHHEQLHQVVHAGCHPTGLPVALRDNRNPECSHQQDAVGEICSWPDDDCAVRPTSNFQPMSALSVVCVRRRGAAAVILFFPHPQPLSQGARGAIGTNWANISHATPDQRLSIRHGWNLHSSTRRDFEIN